MSTIAATAIVCDAPVIVRPHRTLQLIGDLSHQWSGLLLECTGLVNQLPQTVDPAVFGRESPA